MYCKRERERERERGTHKNKKENVIPKSPKKRMSKAAVHPNHDFNFSTHCTVRCTLRSCRRLGVTYRENTPLKPIVSARRRLELKEMGMSAALKKEGKRIRSS